MNAPVSLVLASRSASRQAMLRDAGIGFEAIAAELDERALEAGLGDALPGQIALALAGAKAGAIAAPGQLVLGSDSLIVVDGQRFDKPRDRAEAARHLRWFSGREMQLHSAAAIVRDGEIVWQAADLARLQVRDLSDDFIAAYLDAEWPEVGQCVGVFRMEGRGVQLFDAIDGNYFTVLGMPLLQVLKALRELEAIAR